METIKKLLCLKWQIFKIYDKLTTAWQLPDNCLTTDWQLTDSCLMTPWLFSVNSLITAWRLCFCSYYKAVMPRQLCHGSNSSYGSYGSYGSTAAWQHYQQSTYTSMAAMPARQRCQQGTYASTAATPAQQLCQLGSFAYYIVYTVKSQVLARLVLKHMQAFSDCLWRGNLMVIYN